MKKYSLSRVIKHHCIAKVYFLSDDPFPAIPPCLSELIRDITHNELKKDGESKNFIVGFDSNSEEGNFLYITKKTTEHIIEEF